MNEPQLTADPIFNTPLVIGVSLIEFLVLGVCLWWAASAAFSSVSPSRRVVLAVLRVAIVLLLIFGMLRPTLVSTEIKKQQATLVVLLDHSRSMSVNDAFDGKTRWEALQATIIEALPELRDLGDLQVKVYTFDEEVQQLEFSNGKLNLDAPADGRMTAIGSSLDAIRRREESKRLIGVILLSDGAQQADAQHNASPRDAAWNLFQAGCPLYTVPFGQDNATGAGRDVALLSMPDNLEVFVKNELTVDGVFRVGGFANHDIPVELLFEKAPGVMESVGKTTLRAKNDLENLQTKFSFIPEVPGEHKLTLRAIGQPGELDTSNNELSTYVTVRKGGLNVLYLEGEARIEQRFLRRSLGAAKEVKVDFQWFDHRPADIKNWPVDMSDRFQPGKYDVYILGDIDAKVFSAKDLAALRKAVENGAGLIMLGGFHSFWGGGWMDTPLADLLPMKSLGPNQNAQLRQNFGDKLRSDLQVPGPLQMRPAKKFADMPFLMLGKGNNADLWAKLPPLEGANLLQSPAGKGTFELKDNANVLAEAQNGVPLLIATAYGNGRVLSFAGDSTWHWWMQGHEEEHERFWRQIVFWLARKDESNEGNVRIALDHRRRKLGERLDFTASVVSAQGDPVSGATFEAKVQLPGGKDAPIKLARQGDQALGSFFDAREPGEYTIKVAARKDDKVLGEAQARFVVYEIDLEMSNAAARPTDLASLAKITEPVGGKQIAPEHLADLLRQIKKHLPDLDEKVDTKHPLWDTRSFFLLFVGLLSLEWFLRKRWGLV